MVGFGFQVGVLSLVSFVTQRWFPMLVTTTTLSLSPGSPCKRILTNVNRRLHMVGGDRDRYSLSLSRDRGTFNIVELKREESRERTNDSN